MKNKRFGVVLGVLLALAGVPTVADETASVTIAVMPFQNLCGDASLDWLSRGLAETLSTKLSNVSGIQLVERARLSDAMKELKLQSTALVEPKTAIALGKLIGARYVVMGSYQRSGDSLKADARKVDVATGSATQGVDAVGSYSKVFDIQSELALKLSALLGKAATETESHTLSKAETGSVTAYQFFTHGVDEWAAGNLDAALEAFSKAINLDDKYGEAYEDRGRVYAMRNQSDLAITDYSAAIALNPNNAMLYSLRGVSLNAIGRFDQALADLDKAIELRPQLAAAHVGRGFALTRKGEPERALTEFEKAIAIDPRDPDVFPDRALAYLYLNQYDKAIADYDSAIRLTPSDPLNYHGKAMACEALGRIEEARAAYETTVALAPSSDLPYVKTARDRLKQLSALPNITPVELTPQASAMNEPTLMSANELLLRGAAEGSRNDFDAAIRSCSAAIQIDPRNPVAYAMRGFTYFQKGERDKAIADCTKAIELNPTFVQALAVRGDVYGSGGRFDEAIADYSSALAVNPKDGFTLGKRGASFLARGDYWMAISDYNKAIDLQPSDAVKYSSRGEAYSRKGLPKKALSDFNRAIELDPQSALAYFSRGCFYSAQRDNDLAIADFTTAIERNPKYEDAYLWRGAAYGQQNRLDLDLADLEKVISLNAKCATAYYWKGRICETQGDSSSAIACYSHYTGIAPLEQSSFVAEVKQRIKGLRAKQGTAIGGNNSAPVRNVLTGTWSGTWSDKTDAASPLSGTITLIVDAGGILSGTSTSAAGMSIIGGVISDTGQVSATYTCPGYFFTGSGILSKAARGHLVGTINTYSGGVQNGASIVDLVKQ